MEPYLTFVAAHPWLFAAAGVLVLLIIANEVHGRATGATRLNVMQAVRLINDRDPVIVDVRGAADYKRGHLRGAIHVPAAKVGERSSEIARDKSAPVLLYCNLGGTAAESARVLLKQGYTQVFQLAGGINGWLAANLPVTTK